MSVNRLPCGCIMSTNPLGVFTYQPCSPTCQYWLYVQEQIRERDMPTEVRRARGCWSCGALNDDFMGIGDTDPGTPDEGAISICAYCGAVAVFTGEALLTRKPTKTELADLMADATIRTAVTAIHQRNGLSPNQVVRGKDG